MTKYRCPNCGAEVDIIYYEVYSVHHGGYNIESDFFNDYEFHMIDSKDTTFSCPDCNYLLGNNLDDAIAALIKEDDESDEV